MDDPRIGDFQDMIEHAPCGYITLLPNARVERVNKTLLLWTGHTAEEMTGKRFSDYLHIAGRIYFETHIAPLLRMQGFVSELAFDMITAAGEPIQMIANAVERCDSAGNPLFIRMALLKATDRRRYEDNLLTARDVAKSSLETERQTSELREQFIAVLGHDLRNPLASISAGARILRRDARSDKDHRIITMLETTVLRMAGLIDNVLDFARGRLGGGITLERNSDEPLETVLHQVVDELRLASPGRRIETEYAIDTPVNCDRGRIGQLVSNLVGNALTHGAANQTVDVRAATRDGVFTLSVANGGDPIPEAALAKLFEPFFRGKVRASQQGLGLGLHIAAEIAKAHDGTLTVSSSADETCFTFTMRLR